MNSQKCAKCGLVSWAVTETCKRCGQSFLEDYIPEPPKSKVPDIVSCGLLGIGFLAVAFKDYMGPFGYPVALLSFVLGLGYGIVRVYRSTREPQLDSKRESLVALGVSAFLVLLFGAAIPIYFVGEANPETQPFKWRAYSSAGGNYKIQLPADPQEAKKETVTRAGPLTMKRVTATMGKRGDYLSEYFAIAYRPTLSEEEFLDIVYQSAITETRGGTVLNKKPLDVTAPAGLTVKALESEIRVDEKNSSILRMYWVKERELVYVNVVTFQPADKNLAAAERFLESFQLTQ